MAYSGPSYYPTSQPGYGGHSPSPRPAYPSYPPPPPQQPTMHHHQPPRYNTNHSNRGGPRNGSYNGRGAHHHHHHHPHPHHPQPYYPQQPYSPISPHPGGTVHYAPPPAKFHQAYSPSYPYPSPAAPVFTPSWQTQPISPLPKQLSMPPPQNAPPVFYDQPHASPAAPAPAEPTPASPPPLEIQPAEPSDPPPPTPPPEDSPPIEDIPQSSYTQMGTISTSETLSEDTSSAQNNLTANWAIWSRRPHDPSHAPSIIISPRARPPPDVVLQALDLKTPPPSPPLSPIVSKSSIPNGEPAEPISTPLVCSDAHEPTSSPSTAWPSSQTNSTVPSSAVTESTNTPTIPGSPASSSTSISVAGTPNKDKDTSTTNKPDSDATPPLSAQPATLAATSTTPAEPLTGVSTPLSTTVDLADTTGPASVDVVVSLAGADDPTKPQATPEPTPIPTPTPATVAAPQKKLWSSLLRSDTTGPSTPSSSTGSSSTPTPVRNALPTSSIVGFSIPAETLSSTSTPSSAPTTHAAASLNPAKRKELITLLTTGPNAPTPQTVSYAAATTTSSCSSNADPTHKVRLRGLINMGNMCFANSVLQVLVYCPPFHRFFTELGRVLGSKKGAALVSPPGSGSGNGNGKENVNLLLDATIEFLKEFGDKEKGKKEEGAVLNGKSGKGKERAPMILELGPAGDDEREDGSFLPTNVYDAMKAKKRFESMRGGHQEDAEEFFGFYLDTLEEELLAILNAVNPPPKQQQAKSQVEEKEEAAPAEDAGWYEVGKRNRTVITRTIKATESPITRIFGGKFRSTLRVPGQKDSVVVEDWRSLRLDIQRDQIHTIQEALSFISHPSPVQLSQSAKAGVVEGQQQVLIESLPPILVLHIKRFCYDTTVGGVVKVSKQVLFGPELEIGPDVMAPGTKRPTKYKLFGALYHHGHSASGGHYTLDVLHPNRYPGSKLKEGWIRMDDELVSDVTHEDVFAPNERDDGRCAYLLFYRRV